MTTGILVTIGFVEGWQSEIFTVGILTAVVAAILWKPLKSLQNSKGKTDNSSDMVGLTVLANSEINVSSGTIRYSGIDWQARLAEEANGESISVQSQCEIVAITGNIMLVKAL